MRALGAHQEIQCKGNGASIVAIRDGADRFAADLEPIIVGIVAAGHASLRTIARNSTSAALSLDEAGYGIRQPCGIFLIGSARHRWVSDG